MVQQESETKRTRPSKHLFTLHYFSVEPDQIAIFSLSNFCYFIYRGRFSIGDIKHWHTFVNFKYSLNGQLFLVTKWQRFEKILLKSYIIFLMLLSKRIFKTLLLQFRIKLRCIRRLVSYNFKGYTTVGNQNGSFRRKYAFPVPFGGRNGSSRRKSIFCLRVCLKVRFYLLFRVFSLYKTNLHVMMQ